MTETIEIWNRAASEIECTICGALTELQWGIPTVNGDIVSNDFPNEIYLVHGGSVPVCEACYQKHESGEMNVCDRFYFHLAEGFVGGSGI